MTIKLNKQQLGYNGGCYDWKTTAPMMAIRYTSIKTTTVAVASSQTTMKATTTIIILIAYKTTTTQSKNYNGNDFDTKA